MELAHSTVADWAGRNSKVMRLHILSGSFVDAGEGGGGCPAMDASVWSKLPDDMLWRVLGLVPAAKLFQWHTMSRKWRRVLTSGHFHNTIAAAAAAAAEQQRQRQPGVVACVTQVGEVSMQCMRSSRAKAMRVVDVDLTSFVPTWFWTRHQDGCFYASFSVVAAGDGLVCICNNLWCRCVCSHLMSCDCDRAAAQGTRYCVLNPLTRTCVVLPPAPFVPPANHELRPLRCSLVSSEGAAAAAALTLSKWDDQGCDAGRWEKRMEAATCGLQAGGRWITLHKSVVPTTAQQATRWPRCPPALAQCGGETFFYHAGRVHMLQLAAPPTGAGTAALTSEEAAQGTKRRRRLDEAGGAASTAAAATFDGPSVASLGLDAATIGYEDDVFLVAHRGAIFLVAQLLRRPARRGGNYTLDRDLVAGVWRLDRRRRAWEPVSRLDAQQARRLVASAPVQPLRRATVVVCGASVVGDLLACQFAMIENVQADGTLFPTVSGLTGFVFGFNHDAGEWEVVLDDEAFVVSRDDMELGDWRPPPVVQLRPDLFLS